MLMNQSRLEAFCLFYKHSSVAGHTEEKHDSSITLLFNSPALLFYFWHFMEYKLLLSFSMFYFFFETGVIKLNKCKAPMQWNNLFSHSDTHRGCAVVQSPSSSASSCSKTCLFIFLTHTVSSAWDCLQSRTLTALSLPPQTRCFTAAHQGSRTNVVTSWPTPATTSVRMRGCAH